MSSWPRAVLFDFDGVLVNSEPLHYAAFDQVLGEEGIEITEDEYYRELIGFDDRGAFRHLFAKHRRELDAKSFTRLLRRKSEATGEAIRAGKYTPLPGAQEFVRALVSHYPLAICSGALREEIESMLQGIGLRDCFKVIVAAEDVTIGKPDPQGYLMTVRLLAERAGVPLTPADCLIVEDAPTVIRSVRTVGFKAVGVATSYPAEQLTDADYVAPSLHLATISKLIPELQLGAAR